jgi:hypothetical protein
MKNIILLLSVFIMMAGCKDEFSNNADQLKYQYTWFFNNHCGGYLVAAVPNSFYSSERKVPYLWGVRFSTHYYVDSCGGVPNYSDSGVKSFFLEVRDLEDRLYFRTNHILDYWNGTSAMNAGGNVPGGLYLWKFRLEDLDGVIHEERGTVNVLY